jgi:hypothetical protein
MAQHESEKPGESLKAGAKKSGGDATRDLSSAALSAEAGGEPSQADDAHDAFHGDVEPQESTEQPAADGELAAATAKPRKTVTLGRVVLALVVLAAAVVGAAFAFRNQDERLGAIADSIESAIQNPQGWISGGQEKFTALLGEKPPQTGVPVKDPPIAEDRSGGAPPTLAQKEAPASPPADADRGAAPSAPVEPSPEVKPQPPEPAPAGKPAASAPEAKPQALEPAPTASPREGQETSARGDDRHDLSKRIDQLEQLAQSALKTAEEARAARPREDQVKTAPESLSEREYLTALEGRIDELASEIRAVRERLDAPKSDMRAPQESAEARGQSPKKGAAELVVVAQSLHQELEKGKPYAVELTALTTLGVDPELLSALAPAAEKGALTPAQLLEGFAPVAKRLRGLDAPKSTASYVERVARSFGRLVRVRPASEPAPSTTVSDHVDAIEAALKRADVAAATQAFDRLPDDAKTEESAFGELLRQRRDAEKAAASILSGAIAALGRNKS